MSKKIAFLMLLLTLVGMTYLAPEGTKSTDQYNMLASQLTYKQGKIIINSNSIELNLSANLKYLDDKGAKTVLVDLWGNENSEGILGLIVDKNFQPLADNSWAIAITYEEDGYIKDDDAKKINYEELLSNMKNSTKKYSEERVKAGYSTIELVGWAEPPVYDGTTHKMYWAKELKFGSTQENTLNYNIRILGRKGVLVLNAVSGISQLKDIEKMTPEILKQVNFTSGNRYEDFDKNNDKVAKYGLAALILGGGAAAAAKVGLFKGLWIAILAAKKFIIIGLIAIGAFISKLFSNKKNGANK